MVKIKKKQIKKDFRVWCTIFLLSLITTNIKKDFFKQNIHKFSIHVYILILIFIHIHADIIKKKNKLRLFFKGSLVILLCYNWLFYMKIFASFFWEIFLHSLQEWIKFYFSIFYFEKGNFLIKLCFTKYF